MYGKVLKIFNNDLYGNVDDRMVSVFAAFNHLKYMNRYVIFCFTDEYNKKKLYYGSVHVKNNSLVIFSVNDNNMLQYINKFVYDYLNNRLDGNEFQVFDLSSIDRVELVSYSSMDFEYIAMLDNISIKKVTTVTTEESTNGKKGSFVTILVILLLLIGGGAIYLYLNPGILEVKYKQLNCNMSGIDKKIDVNYDSNLIAKFDKDDKLISVSKNNVYKFSEDEYLDFKDENREKELGEEDGTYKYDDDAYELIVTSEEKLVIQNYDEVYEYIKNLGYSCIEETYEK